MTVSSTTAKSKQQASQTGQNQQKQQPIKNHNSQEEEKEPIGNSRPKSSEN